MTARAARGRSLQLLLSFLLACSAAAVFALGYPASGRGRLDPHVVALELAPDAARAAEILSRWDKSAAIDAIEWDNFFLIAYAAFLLFGGLKLAAARSGTSRLLAWFGACGVFAGIFDWRENRAMIAMLERGATDTLAAAARCNATNKFALIVLSLACLVAGWLLGQKKKNAPDAKMPTPTQYPKSDSRKECDLVMKGGITSGIVYPLAIAELARQYTFRNIGGAFAGAIAAAMTAAAEYARTSGKTDAFSKLEQLPDWLGAPGRLLQLFRPDKTMRPFFSVFVSAVRGKSIVGKCLGAGASALRGYPGWAVAGLLPGLVLGSWPWFAGAHGAGIAVWIASSLVFVPLLLACALGHSLLAIAPANQFGICSGRAPAPAGEVESLTDWLTGMIERLALGLGPDDPLPHRDRPLTFADLKASGINLEMLTNSLTQGRPYRMPLETHELFFDPLELRRIFPPLVCDHLEKITAAGAREDGLRQLPDDELPVVVAVRMSLSFPLLLTAVPLRAIDYGTEAKKFETCWFSDGGIASNFPVHFFDSLLPKRPTFGIDLTPVQRSWVYLPENASAGRSESWKRFDSMPGFFGALVDSIHSWMDNRLERTAGFRDRIVRISLAPDEGGLNLAMTPAQIRVLTERGAVAGRLLVERFAAPGADGWERQLWTRYRLLMRKLEEELPNAVAVLKSNALADAEKNPPTYRFENGGEALSAELRQQLISFGEAWQQLSAKQHANMSDGAPRGAVELRITPKV